MRGGVSLIHINIQPFSAVVATPPYILFRSILAYLYHSFFLNTTTMSAPESTAHSSVEWNEAQCTAALAKLEQLQAQVCHHTLTLCVNDEANILPD
jgi:hypothetical protein